MDGRGAARRRPGAGVATATDDAGGAVSKAALVGATKKDRKNSLHLTTSELGEFDTAAAERQRSREEMAWLSAMEQLRSETASAGRNLPAPLAKLERARGASRMRPSVAAVNGKREPSSQSITSSRGHLLYQRGINKLQGR